MRLKLLTLILLLLQSTTVVLALTVDHRSQSESMAAEPLIVRDRMAQPQEETNYRFQVSTPMGTNSAGTNVWLTLKKVTAPLTVMLLDGRGQQLASATATQTSAARLGQILGVGTYTIRVRAESKATAYSFDMMQTPLTTNLHYRQEPASFLTNLWLYSKSGKITATGIDPNKPTVLLTHGWNRSGALQYTPTDAAFEQLARAIAQHYSNEQVLVLDWGAAAVDTGKAPYQAAGRIEGVAAWTASELKALGIKPQRLTLIGHSLGSFVAAAIGKRLARTANLYALDPAGHLKDRPYDLDEDTPGNQPFPPFASVARQSYAFFSPQTPADDAIAAATAQHSIVIRYTGAVPSEDSARYTAFHTGGVQVFLDLIRSGRLSTAPLQDLTQLRLKTGQSTPHEYDAQGERRGSGTHDGVLWATRSNLKEQWHVLKFNYVFNQQEQTDWETP